MAAVHSTHGDTTPATGTTSVTTTDLEAVREKVESETSDNDDGKPHYPVWQWVLSLVALYLGAILYGLWCTAVVLYNMADHVTRRPRHHDCRRCADSGIRELRRYRRSSVGRPRLSYGICCCHPVCRPPLRAVQYEVPNQHIGLRLRSGIDTLRSCPVYELVDRWESNRWSWWLWHVSWVRTLTTMDGGKQWLTIHSALTFISALGSPKKLPLYNALIGVCWGTGAILGPVIGGAFSVSSATWRWVSISCIRG